MTSLELTRDLATLKSVSSGINTFEQDIQTHTGPELAQARGFFHPDEDNFAKSMLIHYRNYRASLYDILMRRKRILSNVQNQTDAVAFLLEFCSAVMIFNLSSILVSHFYDKKHVRRKLNEADARWGIEADTFDQLLRALTSVTNQQNLASAAATYEGLRPELIHTLTGTEFMWLIGEIDNEYLQVKRDGLKIWSAKAKWGVKSAGRGIKRPILDAAYFLQSWMVEAFGQIWLQELPVIPPSHQRQLTELMEPGDILFMRPELKASTFMCPGWWTHGALYFGGQKLLSNCGAATLPNIQRAWDGMGHDARIIESLASGVITNSVKDSLRVDHTIVVRPKLNSSEKKQAIDDAFSHLGKAYDYDFDFRRADRLVCTELLYRCLHGKGDISFEPNIRLGRPTLSADDILKTILSSHNRDNFDILAASTRDMQSRESVFLDKDGASAFLAKTLGK